MLIDREKWNQKEAEYKFKEEDHLNVQQDLLTRIEELEADLKLKSAYCGELQAQVSAKTKELNQLTLKEQSFAHEVTSENLLLEK